MAAVKGGLGGVTHPPKPLSIHGDGHCDDDDRRDDDDEHRDDGDGDDRRDDGDDRDGDASLMAGRTVAFRTAVLSGPSPGYEPSVSDG
jgi:hypothetical protein